MPSSAFINGGVGSILVYCFLCCGSPLDAQTISLTVVNQAGNSAETHQWARTLDKAGFDRVRIGGSGFARSTHPELEFAEGAILVTGVLDQRGRLHLPGATFARHEQATIRQWVDRTRSSADKEDDQAAFGLAPAQLLSLNKQFAAHKVGATRGEDTLATVRIIAEQLNMRLVLSESAGAELQAAEPILDDLEGLSAGTTLAAILRPWGLALVPNVHHGKVSLQVKPFSATEEFWPIGWPPPNSKNKLVPKLFKREQIEIRDVTLREALDALSPLVELPFLLDHNAMARQGIDLDQTRVSFPSAEVIYQTVIKRVLSQSGLKREIRVDESGTPFLWISPRS